MHEKTFFIHGGAVKTVITTVLTKAFKKHVDVGLQYVVQWRNIGSRWMFGLDDVEGLFQSWWLWEKCRPNGH